MNQNTKPDRRTKGQTAIRLVSRSVNRFDKKKKKSLAASARISRDVRTGPYERAGRGGGIDKYLESPSLYPAGQIKYFRALMDLKGL